MPQIINVDQSIRFLVGAYSRSPQLSGKQTLSPTKAHQGKIYISIYPYFSWGPSRDRDGVHFNKLSRKISRVRLCKKFLRYVSEKICCSVCP